MADTAIRTAPRALGVDDLIALLDELDVAGGEITISRDPSPRRPRWTVHLSTDVTGDGRATCVAQHTGDDLARTYAIALGQLRIEQTARGIR